MKKIPFQLWLIPFLMGTYFYSCREHISGTPIPSDLDLRYGICAAALGMIILIIVSIIPWNELR